MFYLCLDTKNVGQLFLTMEKKIVEVASGGIQVKFNRNSKDLVMKVHNSALSSLSKSIVRHANT